MLAAPRTARRGLRATRRSPNSSGTGSRAASLISVARRRGGLAASARAPTVLVRAARHAGRSVAARGTASAGGPGTGVGEGGGAEPADHQPGRGCGERQDEVLG